MQLQKQKTLLFLVNRPQGKLQAIRSPHRTCMQMVCTLTALAQDNFFGLNYIKPLKTGHCITIHVLSAQ